MGNSGSDTSLGDSCPLLLHFIPTSALQCTAALLTSGKFPHALHRVDEEKALWGQQRRQHREWLVKEAWVVTPYAGLAALPHQTTAQLRLAYAGFSVQYNMGIASGRSLPNEGLFFFRDALNWPSAHFQSSFTDTNNPIQLMCGKKKYMPKGGEKRKRKKKLKRKEERKGCLLVRTGSLLSAPSGPQRHFSTPV